MATSPTTTFPNLSIPQVSVFTQYGINERQVEPLVPLLYPVWTGVISKLMNHMGKPQLVESATRTFEIYRKPNTWGAATISARNQVGSSLVLTFSDPTFQFFPVGNTVISKSGALGIVKTASAGTVTIDFFLNPNGNTAFVSSDFVVGEMASDNGDVTNPYNRQSKQSRYTMPVQYKNIVGSVSDTCQIFSEDVKQRTYLQAVNGKQYYATNKLTETLARMQQLEAVRMYRNIPANFDPSAPVGATIINQILTMGGGQRPVPVNGITESEFQSAIKQYELQGGYNSDEILIIAGSGYLGDLQNNVFKGLVQTAGTNSVLADAAKKAGLNIFTYGYLGHSITLVHEPLFNNPNFFNQSSVFAGETTMTHAAIWINPAMVKTEQGIMMPFAQEYYYTAKDMIVTEINGLTDSNGNPVKTGTNPSLSSNVEINWNKTTQLSNPAGCFYHYVTA